MRSTSTFQLCMASAKAFRLTHVANQPPRMDEQKDNHDNEHQTRIEDIDERLMSDDEAAISLEVLD